MGGGDEVTQRSGAAIFFNQAASTAHTDRVRRMVDLARTALDAELHAAPGPDQLRQSLRERMGDYATVVVVGGDGTMAMGCNIAAEHPDVALGYLPAGFGNAAAHLLGLPREPEAIVDILAAGDARPVDLVAVGGRLALFAGAGWDAEVTSRYDASRVGGVVGWGGAVVRSVPALFGRGRVEVVADGWTVHRGALTLAVISTTPYYGHGLTINPGARPDAGRLSLRVYPGPPWRIGLEAGRWVMGIAPHAERIDAQWVELRSLDGREIAVQVDGDPFGSERSWRFERRPAAVRLIGRWS